MSQRTLKYDIIRCISMCLVLGIHTLNKTQGFAEPYNASWYFFSIGTSICMICNPLFFMLSGKFNLSSNLGTADDYRRYYIKRFASTIVPFVIMSLVCYFVNFSSENWGIRDISTKFLNNEIEGVFWFMYALIPILIFAPFFGKMLQNLNEIECKILFWLLIAVNGIICIVMMAGFSMSFSFSRFGIVTWHLFFFMGYLIEKVIKTRRTENIMIALAGVAFVAELCVRRSCGSLPFPTSDPTPWVIFEALGCYVLLSRIDLKADFLKKVVSFIANQSFVFYLSHMLILRKIAPLFPIGNSSKMNILLIIPIYLSTFIVTLVFSFLINLCIMKPVQKLITKKVSK